MKTEIKPGFFLLQPYQNANASNLHENNNDAATMLAQI